MILRSDVIGELFERVPAKAYIAQIERVLGTRRKAKPASKPRPVGPGRNERSGLLRGRALFAFRPLCSQILARGAARAFETAIVAAFQGKGWLRDRVRGFDCAEVVPRLPGVSSVSCSRRSSVATCAISALGACCSRDLRRPSHERDPRVPPRLGLRDHPDRARMRRVIRALDDERGQVSGSGLGT
jgi:hypothetical protein